MVSEDKSLACVGVNRWKLFASFAFFFFFWHGRSGAEEVIYCDFFADVMTF